MDVRLVCGEEEVGAHRVVLAACSPKLRTVLSRLSHHQHPLIYFWGMDISLVKALLTFMYHGEVNIAQEEIQVSNQNISDPIFQFICCSRF